MFGYRASSNIVRWPNILMVNWVAKRFKQVWSNIGLAPQANNYGSQITQRTTLNAEISIRRNVRLRRLAIQRFKLKKSIAAIILLDILKEDEKRENRRGKTRGWIRIRKEKGYYNNIVQELMIEYNPGYHETMRMTHDDFLEMMLVEPACILLQ